MRQKTVKQRKKTKHDPISLRDFKQWLSGVEDMQGDGWIPDAYQWKKIREKLETIEEVDYVDVEQDMHESTIPTLTNPIYPASSLEFAPQQVPTTPVKPQSSSTPAPITGAPSTHRLMATEEGQHTVTPNIDTSSGTYRSSFS